MPTNGDATRQAPFVGRGIHVAEVRHHLDDGLRACASTLIVKGPAGIGKTRFLEEVSALAERRGANVVWGRAYEHAHVPYLPFRDALLPLLVTRESPAVRVLARVFADRDREGATIEPDDRGRVLLAFAQAVTDAARVEPLVFVLDDLQWADHPTFDVLRHLTWLVQRVPAHLLVIAACRVPLEPGELGSSLELLEREPRCSIVTLPGLADHEVGGLLSRLGCEVADRSAIQSVREATRGNPLMIEQLVAAARAHGAPDTLADLAEHFAQTTVADVLAPRLRALAPVTQEVLTLAALLGPSALRSTLEHAAPGVPVRDALDEGARVGIVTLDGSRVTFTHPVYARVLTTWLEPAERKRMHHRLAEALTRASPRRATAIEIATHFIGAGSLATPDEVIPIAREAGDQALAACAWREAAEFYEAAIDALQRTDGVRLDVAAILQFRAALCRSWNLDDARALPRFDAADALFTQAGDRRAVVRVRLERLRAELDTAGPFDPLDPSPLEAAMGELDAEDPLRAQALADLGMAYVISGRLEEARTSAEDALALALEVQRVPRAVARADLALAIVGWATLAFDDALAHLDAAVDAARAAHDLDSQLAAQTRQPLTLLWLGHVAEADELAAATIAICDRHNLAAGTVYPTAARVAAACLEGRADEAGAFAEEVVLRQRLGDYAWGAAFSLPTFAAAQTLMHGVAAGQAVLREWAALRARSSGGYPWGELSDLFDVAVRLLANPGEAEDVELPAWLAETRLSGAVGLSGLAAAAAEIAWWTRNEDLARNARVALRGCDTSGMRVVDGWLSSVRRSLGIAMAAAGLRDEGRAMIASARSWAKSEHADLEHALCGWWECEIARASGTEPDADAIVAARDAPMSGPAK